MIFQTNRYPAVAAVLLALTMNFARPGPAFADEPIVKEKGLVTRMIKTAIEASQLEGHQPAKPGLHQQDEGWALVPEKLARQNPVAVVLTRGEAKAMLEQWKAAARVNGVLVLAPQPADKEGQFDPQATGKRLEALLKNVHSVQKVPTQNLFLVAMDEDCDDAWALAEALPDEFKGAALLSSPDCPLGDKELAKLTKLHFLLITTSEKKSLASAQAAHEALKQAKVAGVSLHKLHAREDSDHEMGIQAALRWVGLSGKEGKGEETGQLAKDIAGARKLYMTGKYKSAVASYQALAQQENLQVEASIGLSRALRATGKYSQAVEAILIPAEKATNNSQWHLEAAETLEEVGRYQEALDYASQAGRLRPLWAPALVVRGRILETLGKTSDALGVYKRMKDVIAEDKYRNDAEALVALGQIFDRYTVLTGEKASIQASNILHNYFQRAYQKVDRDYWPANIAAGMFLLSKHRADQAMAEFTIALKHNPKCADAYVGAAIGALENWQFEQCMERAEKALEINPNHPMALLAKASCKMAWRKFDEVAPIARKVLETNPNHLDALSLLAAVHIRMRQEDQAQPYIQKVKDVNEGYYGLPLAIAEWLSAGRQFTQAETYYQEAIDLRPELAEPLAGLGKMYMQTGEEVKGREILRKAYELDDYRSDVANFLAVVDRILDPEHFVVRETDHFIIKVDRNYDLIMLDQMAEYMESIYDEVCGDFDHYPDQKTIIEIMPTHQQFSLRIAGRGWIGTVGACTGRVIVLAAPHLERSQLGLHNWAQVMRHEYTHTVTLAATNNNIPHWFTEACAVWQQKDKENYRYVQMLVSATRKDRLFDVKEIDWGFIRPKRRGDRSLAYAQAQWMMEYIISEHGFVKITDMLKAFGQGKTQKQVFEEALGVPEETFDEQFQKWAKTQVTQWGFEAEEPMDLKKAQQQAKKNQDDANCQAELARSLIARRKVGPALKAARKALQLDPKNIPAMKVKAQALLLQKQHDKAIQAARELQKADPTSAVAPHVIARSYLEKRKFVQAIPPLEQLKTQQPLNSFSYEKLAEIYTQLGDPEKALPNLLHLHRHTMREPQYARQIAETYRLMGRDDLAEKYFQEVTYINPYESTAYESIASMQVRQKQYDEALETAHRLTLLEPENARSWDYLAQIRYRMARENQDRQLLLLAKEAAEKSVQLKPDGLGQRILSVVEDLLEKMEAPAE